MRRIMRALAAGSGAVALVAVGLWAPVTATAVASAHPAAAAICGTTTTVPKYKHVILIMEENHSYSTIIGASSAPYINALAKACGVATNYHNITHPSLPNYIAITSAAPFSQLGPFSTDCDPGGTCLSKSASLFSQTGKWKSYVESMPSDCDHVTSGEYAARHNPAVYYTDLTTCKTDDVPLGTLTNSALLKDFSSESTAPAFSVVTPNLCDDMHDCGVSSGDSWLSKWIPKITATTVYKAKDTAIFIIWDEGEGGSYARLENCAAHLSDVSCHVPAIVVAPSVPSGTKVATSFTHFSFVRTVDVLLGLPPLNAQAKAAATMATGFKL